MCSWDATAVGWIPLAFRQCTSHSGDPGSRDVVGLKNSVVSGCEPYRRRAPTRLGLKKLRLSVVLRKTEFIVLVYILLVGCFAGVCDCFV